MSFGIRLHIWGERACFTRPEMKVERVSYDVITPSAARGILEAIHWKPAIRWAVDRIHVLRPIRFESIRRNEVGNKLSPTNVRKAMKAGSTAGLATYVDEERQQRASTVLRDVAYVIEAHFELTERRGLTIRSESIWTYSNGARARVSVFIPRAWGCVNSPPISVCSRTTRICPKQIRSAKPTRISAGCCTTSTLPKA